MPTTNPTDWQRGFGYKWRRYTQGPHTYTQVKVIFKRGRRAEHTEAHTGCDACNCAVQGIQPDWAKRHENDVHYLDAVLQKGER